MPFSRSVLVFAMILSLVPLVAVNGMSSVAVAQADGAVVNARGRPQYRGDGDWQYNLATPSAWVGQCRVVNVALNDRTSRLATISFR